MNLSKPRIMAGLQRRKRLYLQVDSPDLTDELDAMFKNVVQQLPILSAQKHEQLKGNDLGLPACGHTISSLSRGPCACSRVPAPMVACREIHIGRSEPISESSRFSEEICLWSHRK